MKAIYLAAILLSFASAHAAEEGENFSEHKSKMLSQLDERIAKLQELKACATKAADKDALKACHKDMKKWRDDRRGEAKANRAERKNRREERRKAKEESED